MATPSLSTVIEALTIFLKYGDATYPTNCSHDELRVYPNPAAVISDEDLKELDRLGFFPDEDGEGSFLSFAFGSN